MRRVSFHSKKASKKNSLTLLFHHFYSTPTQGLSLSLYTHRVSRDGDAAGERERGHTGTNTATQIDRCERFVFCFLSLMMGQLIDPIGCARYVSSITFFFVKKITLSRSLAFGEVFADDLIVFEVLTMCFSFLARVFSRNKHS